MTSFADSIKSPEFISCLLRTLRIEGRYDRVGPTYFGIDKRYWPHWRGWEVVNKWLRYELDPKDEEGITAEECDNITAPMVEDFYYNNFWIRVKGDQLARFSNELAFKVFDTAVNRDVYPSSQALQRALNILNVNQSRYKDLVDDGKIGRLTLSSIEACLLSNSESRLLKMFSWYNGRHYVERMEADKPLEVNRGWLDRF